MSINAEQLNIEAPNDAILQEDLEQVAQDTNIDWEQFRNAGFLVTGATGLVGVNAIRALLCANRVHGLNMMIFGVARNQEKVASIYGELLDRQDLRIIYEDITQDGFAEEVAAHVDQEIDYIIHGAAVTASKMMVEKPVETIMTAINGTKNLLNLGVQEKVKSFVYLSSMEAYGNMSVFGSAPDASRATEEKMGYINPQNVRSDYPLSKRMCENLCAAYVAEYHLPVKVARLAQTFGAGILPWENRVFAQFAKSAINHDDIVLHTKGLSEGNYCYTADVVRGLLTILLKGTDGEAYNVANESTHTTIADMAQLVADQIAGGEIKVVFDIPEQNMFGYATDTILRLDSTKLQSLGWKPLVPLSEMYHRMILSACTLENH